MSWVTIIWSMVAAACLTLAVVQGLVWFQRRSQWVHLLFALAAIGTAGLTFCELWLMQAETIGEAGRVIRWGHLPFWVITLSGSVLKVLQKGMGHGSHWGVIANPVKRKARA
jgi:hypothetical protein